jgi:hypothetical protein
MTDATQNKKFINALAFTDSGLKAFTGQSVLEITPINQKDGTAEATINENLDRMLRTLKSGVKEKREQDEVYYSYVNVVNGVIQSGYVDTHPSSESQKDLTGFENWFIMICESWALKNNCAVNREKDADVSPTGKYFLKINFTF